MNASDDYQTYPLIKQSKVRKLRTYASSISSNSSNGSSINNSPITRKDKLSHHHSGDTDEGYASFTTTTTSNAFASQLTSNSIRDDSAYYTSTSSSKIIAESDSEKSELSDGDDDQHEQIDHQHQKQQNDDTLRDLVDWSSLNEQVQTLVSRLDKWLHHPLPDRSIPIGKSLVDHAYPILQRRSPSIPLTINLAGNQPTSLPYQSDFVLNFVQNETKVEQRPTSVWKIPRPRVHFQLQKNESLKHCHSCSRIIHLSSSINQQRSIITCPYCDQTYCSKACQKSDWPIHKRSCILSNSYSCCGHILRLMKSNDFLLQRLSALASSGYLSSGRGATLLYFDSMDEADAYVQSISVENTRLMAIYWALTDGKMNRAIENLRATEYEHLKELAMNYDPSREFVCHVTIRVEADTDDSRYTCVSRTTIYNLSENLPSTTSPPSTFPTLYLSSINYRNNAEPNYHMRQVFFAKLQTELRQRGIDIEEHYPELYHKLCDYLSPSSVSTNNEKLLSFTPICLFMRHRYSHQLFMCVITPESEPDRSWLIDRCLVEKNLVTSDE